MPAMLESLESDVLLVCGAMYGLAYFYEHYIRLLPDQFLR